MTTGHKRVRRRGEPRIVIDGRYAEQLKGLAVAAMDRSPEVGDRLLHEIERARIVHAGRMPPRVVNIGSRVSFVDEVSGRGQTVTLVMPCDADIARGRVSVVTPIGAALIGLSQGASITWETRDGQERRLTVVEVHQAEDEAPDPGA